MIEYFGLKLKASKEKIKSMYCKHCAKLDNTEKVLLVVFE